MVFGANLIGQEQWELRGVNEARIRALETQVTALANALLTSTAGVQIRQGTAVVTTDAGGLATITYDVAFPTDTLNVVCCESQGIDRLAVPQDPGGGSWTATGFGVHVRIASSGADAAGGHRINYIAVGN